METLNIQSNQPAPPAYLITFQDTLSGATEKKLARLTAEQYAHAIKLRGSGAVVVRKYANGINWQWFIKEIQPA
jgi:Rps23 Pro-64 3,4-dihydroxylase Tpa1-like proline 4-hydroxylase